MYINRIGDNMINTLDFNNEDVMTILSNPSYTEEQKKDLFEKYKTDLKDSRRKEIINRLNKCAKENPIITQEEYINFLKQYNNDDLSKPFEIIEKELNAFSNKMKDKYELYLKAKEEENRIKEEEAKEVQDKVPEEEFDLDDITPDVTPYHSSDIDNTSFKTSNIEENDNLKATVFENSDVKEIKPENLPGSLDEKGNASAIIISIIAIIVGMVVMYSILKLK